MERFKVPWAGRVADNLIGFHHQEIDDPVLLSLSQDDGLPGLIPERGHHRVGKLDIRIITGHGLGGVQERASGIVSVCTDLIKISPGGKGANEGKATGAGNGEPSGNLRKGKLSSCLCKGLKYLQGPQRTLYCGRLVHIRERIFPYMNALVKNILGDRLSSCLLIRPEIGMEQILKRGLGLLFSGMKNTMGPGNLSDYRLFLEAGAKCPSVACSDSLLENAYSWKIDPESPRPCRLRTPGHGTPAQFN
jgi:hypothetical protein